MPTTLEPTHTARVIQTSKSGDALADRGTWSLGATSTAPADACVLVDVDARRQTLVGFGGSFTHSTAAALSALSPEARRAVIESYFGDAGARYSLTRTTVGSSDFSPTGRFAYSGRSDLADFSVAVDEDNGLLPLIRDARAASTGGFRVIASPWTAPPFMKTGGQADGWFGGRLQRAHYPTFARYLARYVEAYRALGVDIWAITPINEPHGNDDNWESMRFEPEEMRDLLREGLGAEMQRLGVRILIFDQNRAEAQPWAEALFGDPETRALCHGTAVHWYGSTFMVFEEALDALHDGWPDKLIINTEACVDAIWNDPEAWTPVPAVGTQLEHTPAEIHYWQDWSWWWAANTTDWGFTWAAPEDRWRHPRYAAANRYIRDIIGGLNHHLAGWVDWNMVLDERGGPNHVGNYCAAPVLVHSETREVFYTPLYFVMSHFSRYLRPGAAVLETTVTDGLIATAGENLDGTIAVVVANVAAHPDRIGDVVDRRYRLALDGVETVIPIPAHAIQTVVVESGR